MYNVYIVNTYAGVGHLLAQFTVIFFTVIEIECKCECVCTYVCISVCSSNQAHLLWSFFCRRIILYRTIHAIAFSQTFNSFLF